jgi:hypothetical protein
MSARAAFSPEGRTLITGHADDTLFFWDVSCLMRGATRPGKPSAVHLEKLWEGLGGSKAQARSPAAQRLLEALSRGTASTREAAWRSMALERLRAPCDGNHFRR